MRFSAFHFSSVVNDKSGYPSAHWPSPPWDLKPLLTLHRAHPPRSGSRRGWQLTSSVTSSHSLADANTRPLWAHALRALDYWKELCYGQGGPVKSSFDCLARGYGGRSVTLSQPWSAAGEEESSSACKDGVLGPRGLFDWHLSNKAITDHSCVFVHFTNCSAHEHSHKTMWITATHFT